jgi:hypothetical protein
MGAKADLVRHDIITHHEPADLRCGPQVTGDVIDVAQISFAPPRLFEVRRCEMEDL